MKTLPKKKYKYNFLKYFKQNTKWNTKQNTKNNLEQKHNVFLFSPIPLSESLTLSQLHSFFLQDTFYRFLKNKKNSNKENKEKNIYFNFSENIYKALGNQTVQTSKIKKQHHQNKKKIEQSFIENYTEKEKPFSESILCEARNLIGELLESNILKQKKYISLWDTELAMSINSSDQEKKEETVPYYQIKYFIDGKGVSININTYEPYFLFSIVAIAVNPKDRRYSKYLDRHVLIPIINKKVPIITDERINMIEGEWAVAINPWHDQFSLNFAKEHNLDTTISSIDQKWFFTTICWEFSGKNIKEYKENVIKFIQDIGNLSILKKEKKEVYYNKNTGNILYPISENQIILHNEEPSDIFTNTIYWWEKKITIPEEIVIWNYFKLGWLFSLDIDNNFFSEKELIENKEINETEIAFILLFINIILEGRLEKEFLLEDFIQRIFEDSYTEDFLKYEAYLDFYEKEEKYGDTLKKGIKNLRQILKKAYDTADYKDFEILINNSAFFSNTKNRRYHFSYDTLKKSSLFIDQSFLNSILLKNLFEKKNYSDLQTKDTVCYTLDSLKEIQLLLLLQKIGKISLPENFEKQLYFFPSLCNKDNKEYTYANSKIEYNNLQELQKKYWPDILRYLFVKNKNNFNYDKEEVPYIERLEQKVWNISRFVLQKEINQDFIEKTLTENMDQLNDFDLWILKQSLNLLEQFELLKRNNNFIEILPLLEEYLLSYFDLYIEIQKEKKSKYSDLVLSYCFVIFLKHLSFYFPVLCTNIENFFNFNTIKTEGISLSTMEYKCNIFSEIITTIQNLKIKNGYMKHEKIDLILCASADIKLFLEENIKLIQALIHTKEIRILEYTEIVPDNYIFEQLIDTKIAIKKTEWLWISKKESLEKTKKEIAYIEDEIQRKKLLLGRILPLATNEKINEKKSEINALKEKLENFKRELLEIKA